LLGLGLSFAPRTFARGGRDLLTSSSKPYAFAKLLVYVLAITICGAQLHEIVRRVGRNFECDLFTCVTKYDARQEITWTRRRSGSFAISMKEK
jgi:hypothetical protein